MSHGKPGPGAPLSHFGKTGKFGRLFALPPAFDPADAAVTAGINALGAPGGPMDGGIPGGPNSTQIAAGITYLGQFVDHDLTFEPTSILGQLADVEHLHNFRTPALDLDSLYGGGPDDQPYLYTKDDPADDGRYAFAIGSAEGTADLPRFDGIALIGDKRNDENFFVSKLHLSFLLFHNAVLRHVKSSGLANRAAFDEAHRLVRWHYQWIVAHEFLETICDPAIVQNARDGAGRSFYTKAKLGFTDPFIPVEFSGAAYRFGHSLVREAYRLVPGGPFRAIFPGAPIPPIQASDPIAWRVFFRDGRTGPMPQNPAHDIDETLVRALMQLPIFVASNPSSLAQRNLLRGVTLGLPSGQAVAQAIGAPVLTDAQVAGATPLNPVFAGRAPLWFYVLREAAVQGSGQRLGTVGSTIVAEVILGVLDEDPFSYRNQNPTWTPELPSTTPGDYTMSDMQKMAGTF